MPGENIQDWSITAANNGTADSSINWVEGQARASVNDSARSMMAAHAKDRNLKNGSISTGGTANAQTFTSGVSYTAVPTGLRATLKIGVTNTGATTLNMDGIGAVAIKNQFGFALGGGELIIGSYADFCYDGTNWILLSQSTSIASATINCGRLRISSGTTLSFAPFNGDRIKINGSIYAIPAGGIAGLTNSGAFVGGIASQSLAGTAVYLVYAFDNSGAVTGDFRLLGSNPHATSSTPGNVGTEIATGDNTRTLLGMIMTDAGGGFVDSPTNRLVISWFNRRNLAITGAIYQQATASATLAEVSVRCNFLTWGDESVYLANFGSGNNNTAAFGTMISVGLDAAAIAQSAFFLGTAASQWGGLAAMANVAMAEGFHTLSGFGAAPNGGTATLSAQVTGSIRG